MSLLPTTDPVCDESASEAIELVLEGRPRDVGGFAVRRALPARERRLVGPFIFLDEMGPAVLPAGQGIDVRPHPHIGLGTLTYLSSSEPSQGSEPPAMSSDRQKPAYARRDSTARSCWPGRPTAALKQPRETVDSHKG